MKKAGLVSFLLFTLLGLTACPDYNKVREMSKKQLEAQKEFKLFFELYMTKVYAFAEIQVRLAKIKLNDLEGRAAQVIQATGDAEIATLATDPEKNARRQQIGAELLKNQQDYKSKRDDLDQLLVKLQAKHREILDTYQVLVEAQTELDRYVQLKRFDERIVDQIAQRINVNQIKLNQHINEATNILGGIGR